VKIPTKVVFPFKYIVKIEQVSSEELGIATNDPQPGYAAWSVDKQTIYLDKSRPIKNRRADLVHELGHAFLDWQAWILNTPLAEAKG
jgi:Zn-dependent peptidase ImmA (M78 family)